MRGTVSGSARIRRALATYPEKRLRQICQPVGLCDDTRPTAILAVSNVLHVERDLRRRTCRRRCEWLRSPKSLRV